ncbi:MAG TPA: NUDIX hydrolase [Candidatus Saccharimonadales bacterium]
MPAVHLVAKTIVVDGTGRILLLRRSPTDHNRPHDWDFPGGGLEKGESYKRAAMRELREETSLTYPETGLKLVYAGTEFYEPAERIYFRHLYTARFTDGQAVKLSFEHDYFEWMDVDKALEVFQHRFYNPGLRFARDHGLLN